MSYNEDLGEVIDEYTEFLSNIKLSEKKVSPYNSVALSTPVELSLFVKPKTYGDNSKIYKYLNDEMKKEPYNGTTPCVHMCSGCIELEKKVEMILEYLNIQT